jgi:hypothetical protein
VGSAEVEDGRKYRKEENQPRQIPAKQGRHQDRFSPGAAIKLNPPSPIKNMRKKST